MARIDTLANFLTDVAAAIKTKKGDATAITPANFDIEITNLPSGGETPSIGFTVDEWTTTGYATKVTIYGMTSIPAGAFYRADNRNLLQPYLKRVVLPSNVTSIGDSCFSMCSNLVNINLNDGITNIGTSGFNGCQSLLLSKIPSSVTTLKDNAFYNCYKITPKTAENVTTFSKSCFWTCKALTQMSMPKATTISSPATNTGAFYGCTSLKAVWIGSSVTSSGMGRYIFAGCGNLSKIFIDLPRATVESFTNYQYAFMNDTTKTGIVVCNDDAGFMTQTEFDAIDWSVV